MKNTYADVREDEKGVLDRQFAKCRFFQHCNEHPQRRPTRLAIFDFDSTLFYSPLLSPTLWHPTLVHALTNEGLCGPGWWRDIRSLELGLEVEQSGWQGFWNPSVVAEARGAIADEATLAVVLTGRRVHPFYGLVSRMLASQGLEFEMVCLRPDPEDDATGASVFDSTMDYKLAFLLHLLHTVPSITTVDMWDDRPHHVRRFQAFLDQLCTAQQIDAASVHFVHAVRPRYNPKWERQVVDRILHPNKYTLVPVASSTVIMLDTSCVAKLRSRFCYRPPAKMSGEVPVLFGEKILLALKDLPRLKVPFGGVGTRVEAKVVASFEHRYRGLFLKVRIRMAIAALEDMEYSESTYCLPLYFKPSERAQLTRFQEWQWEPAHPQDQLILQGKVDYSYLLGIDTLNTHPKRKHDDD